MQGAWARFAKNPLGGPGWNSVGTGQAGTVLSGAYGSAVDGIYYDGSGNATVGDWDLAILGDVGKVKGAGATIYPQRLVDYRCVLYKPVYQAIVGTAGIPPP